MSALYLIICLLVLSFWFFYKRIKNSVDFWNENEIAYIPVKDGIKQFFQTIAGFQSGLKIVTSNYNNFAQEKVVGFFNAAAFFKKGYFIKDPDLMKHVLIKDFNHFTDRTNFIFSEEVDPLLGRNLLGLSGQRWKSTRAVLTPTFTGGKMRFMFDFMRHCGETMITYYKNEIAKQNMNDENEQILDIELKNALVHFTNDVVASTAFGYQCDSFNNPENIFFQMGQIISKANPIRISLLLLLPTLARLLQIGIVPVKATNYFSQIIKNGMLEREKNNIVRPDMLHLLMETKKANLNHEEDDTSHSSSRIDLSDEDIIAQTLIFFIAGFDSVSNAMCFTIYEMALNPDIQKKLQIEIDEAMTECDGNVTYNTINQLTYLEMVISESLRKWPPFIQADRVCTKNYTLHQGNGKKDVHFKPGDVIEFPIYAIHHDPQYYPNPDKFDPERFNESNRHKLTAASVYLPFGMGPRNCIGSRFALLEMKVCLVYLLANFEIVVTKKTDIPLNVIMKIPNITSKNGFWVGLKQRAAY